MMAGEVKGSRGGSGGGRGVTRGGVGDGKLGAGGRGEWAVPGLGRAVGRVDRDDGRHARRFDGDQGRSPPKKISSTARVPT